MNFLIISDDKLFIDDTSKKLNNINPENKSIIANFNNDSILRIKNDLDSISVCIIHSKDSLYSPLNEVALLFGLTGFLIAKNVPVVTNNKFLCEQSLFSDKNITYLENEDTITKYLTDNYELIETNDIKDKAKKALFSLGIPYTSDCFATYIAKNKMDICKHFVDAGISIDSVDDSGTSMLNVAVRNDREEMVKFLVESGANINVVSEDRGYTPVMDAVWRGNVNITKYLVEKKADLNTISKEGQSNLVLAVGANKIDICKILAENGADPDIKDMMGMSAYNYATLFKKEQIIEILKPFHKE